MNMDLSCMTKHFRTFMREAETNVSGRPLAVDELASPSSLEPLTPDTLLTLDLMLTEWTCPQGSLEFFSLEVNGRNLKETLEWRIVLFVRMTTQLETLGSSCK